MAEVTAYLYMLSHDRSVTASQYLRTAFTVFY